MNINIQYNENVIKKFQELDIYPDISGSSMFVLFALAENKISLLNFADDSNKSRRMIILYRFLERRKLLKQSEKEDNLLYTLTREGLNLVKWLKNEFDDEIVAEDFIEPKIEDVKEIDNSWESFAEEFAQAFPKSHRADPKVVLIRLEKFFKTFPEYRNQEVLLKAAKLYVKENQRKDPTLKFMRHCQYFIFKSENKETIYELANWYSQALENKSSTSTNDIDLSFLNLA